MSLCERAIFDECVPKECVINGHQAGIISEALFSAAGFLKAVGGVASAAHRLVQYPHTCVLQFRCCVG